jgi:hypothetical protein
MKKPTLTRFRPLLSRLFAFLTLGLLSLSAAPQNGYEVPEPMAPTSAAECDAFQRNLEQRAKELDAQANAIHDKLYHSCADLRDNAEGVRCWDRLHSGTYQENTECGSILYNFPQQERAPRFQAACAYARVHQLPKTCRDKVSSYLQSQHQQEIAIQQAGDRQRAAISSAAGAQVSTLDASRASADTRAAQLNQRAQQQRQISEDAQALADYYRNQAANATQSGRQLTPSQLARIQQAQELARLTAQRDAPGDSLGGTATVAVNLDSTEFRTKVSELLRADGMDYLKFGLKSELERSGLEGRALVQTWDMSESALSKWNTFSEVADAASKISNGTATPDETLHWAADAAKATGEPLFGLDTMVGMQSATLSMADHAFASAQPLFSTNPESGGSSYDPTSDITNVGLQLKSFWPGFDKLQRAADALDAGARLAKNGLNAFNRLLYY